MPADEQQLSKELGGTLGCLGRLLQHMYVAERDWLKMLQDRALPPLGNMHADGPGCDLRMTISELAEAWPRVWADWTTWLESLQPVDLDAPVTAVLSARIEVPLTVGALAMHCFNHASMHRGQAVTMLRMLGRPSRNLDLMGYLITSALADTTT